jgi:hypothetical protein
MAAFETALAALLAAAPEVLSRVGTRIHPVLAPQDSARPFLVYRVTSRQPFAPMTGTTDMARTRVSITAWADDWRAATELADAVAQALEGHVGGAVTPGAIQAARVVQTAEGYDEAAGYFGRTLDINFIHQE